MLIGLGMGPKARKASAICSWPAITSAFRGVPVGPDYQGVDPRADDALVDEFRKMIARATRAVPAARKISRQLFDRELYIGLTIAHHSNYLVYYFNSNIGRGIVSTRPRIANGVHSEWSREPTGIGRRCSPEADVGRHDDVPEVRLKRQAIFVPAHHAAQDQRSLRILGIATRKGAP